MIRHKPSQISHPSITGHPNTTSRLPRSFRVALGNERLGLQHFDSHELQLIRCIHEHTVISEDREPRDRETETETRHYRFPDTSVLIPSRTPLHTTRLPACSPTATCDGLALRGTQLPPLDNGSP